MAVEITRSLEEIDQKVKGLNKTLKDSQTESRELDKALKLDPKSAETCEKIRFFNFFHAHATPHESL